MSFVGALAIAAVAIFMAAKPAAAEQCWPTVLPSPDPTPLDRPKPPKPKCDFPAGVKNHEMAGLYLYDTECEHKPSPLLTRLSAEFRKLPDDLRAIALDHERKLIEAIPRLYDHEVPLAPGGWAGFCRRMNLWMDGSYTKSH